MLLVIADVYFSLRKWLRSSVSLRLLRCVIVFFRAIVDKFDRVSVLSTGHGSLTLLIGHEGLDLLNIIKLTIGETQVIPLIETSPDGGQTVRGHNIEELRHVENVEELDTISDIEPHPVSV